MLGLRADASEMIRLINALPARRPSGWQNRFSPTGGFAYGTPRNTV